MPRSAAILLLLLLSLVPGCSATTTAPNQAELPDAGAGPTSATGAAPGTTESGGSAGALALAGSGGAAPGVLDAGAAREPTEAPLRCSPRDPSDPGADFSTDDPAFLDAFSSAKRACGSACGYLLTELDADGCVVGTDSLGLNLSPEASTTYLACLLDALTAAGACSRCEASQTRRFYESCTIL